MFKTNGHQTEEGDPTKSSSFYSRGKFPVDCGDAGCIAVDGENVAVSVDDGEIFMLAPSWSSV
jgi:hypothetical protein